MPTQVRELPPGPTPASLHQFGNTAVGYYTGNATLSIPIYTLPTTATALAVSLGYQAGGLRVVDKGSWVGLGWSLQAGGVISRTVNGRPDEEPNGYQHMSGYMARQRPPFLPQALTQASHDFFAHAATGQVDTEPDVFNYTFGSYSGQFVLDSLNRPVLTSTAPLTIEGGPLGGTDGQPFVITTEDGTRYTFAQTEQTHTVDPGGEEGLYISSWYLTRVEPLVGHALTLTYTEEDFQPQSSAKTESQSLLTQSTSMTGQGAGVLSKHLSAVNLSTRPQCLRTISWAAGSLVFHHSQVPGFGPRLDSIWVQRADNTLRQRFQLRYQLRDGRLFLMQFQELAAPSPLATPAYTFTYEPGQLPDLESLSQDYWGYYNGALNIGTLRPLVNGSGPSDAADREPHVAFARRGMLTQVSYPTGGFTQFSYEPHDYGAIEKTLNPATLVLGGQHQVAARVSYNRPPTTDRLGDSTTFVVHGEQSVLLMRTKTNYSQESSCSVGLRLLPTADHPALAVALPTWVPIAGPAGQQTFTGFGYVRLTAGRYVLSAQASTEGGGVQASISLQVQDSLGTTVNRLAGGVRVRQITDYAAPGVPTLTRRFLYRLAQDTTRSSGALAGNFEDGTSLFAHQIITSIHGDAGGATPGGTPSLTIDDYRDWSSSSVNLVSCRVNLLDEDG